VPLSRPDGADNRRCCKGCLELPADRLSKHFDNAASRSTGAHYFGVSALPVDSDHSVATRICLSSEGFIPMWVWGIATLAALAFAGSSCATGLPTRCSALNLRNRKMERERCPKDSSSERKTLRTQCGSFSQWTNGSRYFIANSRRHRCFQDSAQLKSLKRVTPSRSATSP